MTTGWRFACDLSTELRFCLAGNHEVARSKFMSLVRHGGQFEAENCQSCLPEPIPPSIAWENTCNVQLYEHMRRLQSRLIQRSTFLRGQEDHDLDNETLKKYQQKYEENKLAELGNSDLGSLDRLNAAMGKWLDELEKEKTTFSTWTRENGFRAENFDRMDTASMPLDGKLVSRALLKQIHAYEKDWNQRYDRGEDPDQLAVPSLTKEILADIIKQCPALERYMHRDLSFLMKLESTNTISLTGFGKMLARSS